MELIEELGEEAEKKGKQVLRGAVVEASQVIIQGLKQPSYSYRLQSAKEILDRVYGKPTQTNDINENRKVTILSITASAEELEALKKPLTVLETDKQTPPKPLESPVITGEIVEITKV